MLQEFGYPQQTTVVYCDNKTTISQIKEYTVTKRTRHIDIRSYSAAEFIAGKIMNLVHLPGDQNWSDMLTKALSAELLTKFRSQFLTG